MYFVIMYSMNAVPVISPIDCAGLVIMFCIDFVSVIVPVYIVIVPNKNIVIPLQPI